MRRVFSHTRLKTVRQERRISREYLGEKVGRTMTAVRDIEQGLHFPSVPVLAAMADVLNVKIDDLFVTVTEDAHSA